MKNAHTPLNTRDGQGQAPATPKTLDQRINEMSVLCEFPNDRDYCADIAGTVRSFPITQGCRRAIKQLLIDELESCLRRVERDDSNALVDMKALSTHSNVMKRIAELGADGGLPPSHTKPKSPSRRKVI